MVIYYIVRFIFHIIVTIYTFGWIFISYRMPVYKYAALYLSFALLLTTYSLAQTVHPDYVDGQVYIKVKKLVNPGQIKTSAHTDLAFELPFLSKFSDRYAIGKAEQSFYFATNTNIRQVYRLTLTDPKRINKLIDELSREANVEYVEKVPLMRISLTPNDLSINAQYHLGTIHAYEAWNVSQGNSVIKIAICDNAIQTNHPDLQGNMLSGYDVADGDNDPNPPNAAFSHGTHVAGITGAVTNNGVGVASMGFNKIKLIPVKSTQNSADANTVTHAYEGVVWASQNGANIINTSWGGGAYSLTEQAIANDVYSRGIVWVASAGNNSSTALSYPAAYDNIVSVVSTTSTDVRSSFSTYGNWVDLCAPGSSIYSSIPYGAYEYYSGTSMASPLAASVFGYVWSVNPLLTNTQLIALIKSTCDNIDAQNPGESGLLGSGRINALRAVQQACPNPQSISISPAGSVAICEGSSLTLVANSLINGTYQWTKDNLLVGTNSNTLTAVETGVYGLTFRAADGCPSIATAVNLTVIPNALAITTNKSPVLCGADSVVLTIPSMPGAIIQWQKDGGAVGTNNSRYVAREAGDYTVQVSAPGISCTAISDVLAISSVAIDAQIVALGSTQLCSGQSVSLKATSIANASYQWRRGNVLVGSNSNTLSVNTTGSYTVSILKEYCTFVSSASVVTVMPGTISIAGTRPTTFCSGDSTVLVATNVLGLPYVWQRNGAVLSGVSSNSLTVRVGGIYTLKASFPSCQVASAAVTVTVPSYTVVISSATNTTLACTTSQIPLTATSVASGVYKWLRNGTLVAGATSATYAATQGGAYQTAVTADECVFSSNTLTLLFLSSQSIAPSAQSLTLCGLDPEGGSVASLTATPAACPISTTVNATYSGGTIGYDNGAKSGADPSVVVAGLSQLSALQVSITWEKKDGGSETSCSTTAGLGSPFNYETQFRLQSPQGTIITLVPLGQYGGVYAGVVTTVFVDGGTSIASGQTPAGGTFAPSQSLSTFFSENPNGTWILLPYDGDVLDPLCVSGFSLKLITPGTNQPPVMTWWDAATGGNLLASGAIYTPVSSTVSARTFYAQSVCTGQCPSVRVATTLSQFSMHSIKSGNWTDVTTWSCNRVPTSADAVYIDNGHTVSVNQAGQVAKRIVYRGGTLRFQPATTVRLSVN